jgi:hypothetical protein
MGLFNSFQRDCKRLRRWLLGSDPTLAKHRASVGYTYGAGMEPGSWDEAQGRRGLAATRRREAAMRRAAAQSARGNHGTK